MRKLRFSSALVAILLTVGSAFGQQYPITITSAKIGLPPGPGSATPEIDSNGLAYLCKPNTWAPIYLELKFNREVKANANIVVETTDPDSLGTATVVPLQNLADIRPGTQLLPEELASLPYFRVSNREVTVAIRESVAPGTDPTRGRLLSEPKRINYILHRDTSSYFVLSLGTKLSTFELPNAKVENAAGGRNNPRVEQAVIDNLFLLPDRWYGYDAADLVVLSTGAVSVDRFLTPLFRDPAHKPRLDALIEWVRRGGRLLVSVGTNASIASQYPILQELLPMQIRPAAGEQVKELYIEYVTETTSKKLSDLTSKSGTFPIATLTPHPNRGYTQLLPPAKTVRENARQTIVQAPYGLGRVTLVTFDLDRSPFAEYSDRPRLWEYLVQNAGSKRAPRAMNVNNYGISNHEDELANDLRGHTDWFSGVPVISFSWVALFIILYTLLVGPVEYILLKKVFKRLELTWITFPIIVLTVSAIAYYSAYALKGTDLKLNKVDLIDVDPTTNRIYGHTWFTIFSPKIANYTIGVEPNEKWIAKGNEAHGGALVDWTGVTVGQKNSFFRRSYHYNLAQAGDPASSQFTEGLVDVPIQVWSTKAFLADWSCIQDKQIPLVVSDLNHPPSKVEDVAGTFTLNLPFPQLQDVYLIYAGKAYKWDPITSGVPVNTYLNPNKLDNDWLNKLMSMSVLSNSGNIQPMNMRYQNRSNVSTSTGVAPIFHLMFHDESIKDNDLAASRNATLRRIDQSWRISPLHQNELIVVGRVPTLTGSEIEDTMSSPDSGSPTTIWMKELPNGTKPRTKTPGKLQQETFVRVYVPVKPTTK